MIEVSSDIDTIYNNVGTQMLTFESFEISGWFIMSPIGINIGGKAFLSKKEAEDFKKKFKYSSAFKTAKIVEGSVDKNGFVTPYR